MKYKDRREQRNVSEVMDSLLIPMFPCFNEKTSKLVWTALKIIRETEVENEGLVNKSQDLVKDLVKEGDTE